MITGVPAHRRERITFVLISGLLSFLLAFFIDQYFILDKGWWFLMDLVN